MLGRLRKYQGGTHHHRSVSLGEPQLGFVPPDYQRVSFVDQRSLQEGEMESQLLAAHWRKK